MILGETGNLRDRKLERKDGLNPSTGWMTLNSSLSDMCGSTSSSKCHPGAAGALQLWLQHSPRSISKRASQTMCGRCARSEQHKTNPTVRLLAQLHLQSMQAWQPAENLPSSTYQRQTVTLGAATPALTDYHIPRPRHDLRPCIVPV